jgi:16S rRNA (cytidine1402-2'-O)-methyltransferase
MEDITYRAVHILKEVDLILAEDTRTSKNLLDHYKIENKTESYHQHNEHKKVPFIIRELLTKNQNAAVITDAGMPGISDPGFLLVRECLKNNIPVETLPGATAFLPALSNSGLPSDKFVFEGFLPHKKGRNKRLEKLAEEERTIVLYESPYRLVKTLRQLAEHLHPERNAAVSRELTKIHEENVRGTLTELADYYESKKVKGEIVIICEGKPKK